MRPRHGQFGYWCIPFSLSRVFLEAFECCGISCGIDTWIQQAPEAEEQVLRRVVVWQHVAVFKLCSYVLVLQGFDQDMQVLEHFRVFGRFKPFLSMPREAKDSGENFACASITIMVLALLSFTHSCSDQLSPARVSPEVMRQVAVIRHRNLAWVFIGISRCELEVTEFK